MDDRRRIEVEFIGDPLASLRELADVRVTIRCATCGATVLRGTASLDTMHGHLSCDRHGDVDVTIGDLHHEWTRRNKPSSFTIKRKPLG